MRIFHGKRTEAGAAVTVESKSSTRALDARFDLRNHSPSGFEWGYGGSGPAQLALAICCAVVGDKRGQAVYQQFKDHIICTIQANEWWMDEPAVMFQIEQIEHGKTINPRRWPCVTT